MVARDRAIRPNARFDLSGIPRGWRTRGARAESKLMVVRRMT